MSDFDISAVTQAKLADLRRRVLNREPVTPEEYRVVLESLRTARRAQSLKAPAKKTSEKPKVDTDKLLNDFI